MHVTVGDYNRLLIYILLLAIYKSAKVLIHVANFLSSGKSICRVFTSCVN